MRKYLFVVALFWIIATQAQTWKDVGSPKFSLTTLNGLGIVLDTNYYPYIGYADKSLDYKMTVQRFNGITWIPVGATGFTPGETYDNGIALDSKCNPYVVFTNLALTHNNASVMKFDGSNWIYIGPPDVTPNLALSLSIAIGKNDTPYISFSGDARSGAPLGVLKFDGTNWTHVGPPGFSGVDISISQIVMGKKDTPFVCYNKSVIPKDIIVKKFDGANWISVDDGSSVALGQANFVSMTIDTNGTPYVAYDDANNGSKATVKKYVGGKWQPVGIAGFSSAQSEVVDIAISKKQQLYVSFADYSVAKKTTVMTFFNGAWVPVGVSGFSSGSIDLSVIAVDTMNIPYVFYRDSNDSYNGYIRSPELSAITGVDTLCKGLDVAQANIMTGGIWSSGNTAKATVNTTGKVTGLDTGAVVITYTVANMSVIHTISVKDCRLEVPSTNEASISVFPNPTNDGLNISGVVKSMNYRLLNLTGTSMCSGALSPGNNTISMSLLPPGVYMLEMRSEDGERKVVRVVKE